MRSTPWTSDLAPEARYELCDSAGAILGASESRGEAVRMLQAYVLTSPEREEDVWLVSLSRDGRVIVREDILDIELAH